MKLLLCHWKKHRSFPETVDVFNELMDSGLRELVPHPDCLYRIMIEVALEAGKKWKLNRFWISSRRKILALVADVRIPDDSPSQRRRRGDWEGVLADIKAAKIANRKDSEYLGKVFIPILKIYVKEHSILETEAFLRLYIDQLRVPVSRYMVALMANIYGAERDMKSFLQWIEYCVSVGFRIDSGFANAILVNCKRRWGFSFINLRRIFLNIKALSPGCMDKATEHFMTSSAIADGGGPAARGRAGLAWYGSNQASSAGEMCVLERAYFSHEGGLNVRPPKSSS